ncbi:MAG: CRISPR-associated endonuclease Cas2 [Gammaproteobacteria bacterium]|jgi:CRISPR-associated protein Cas2
MFYLAAYDVSDPKRLQRALHVLRDYATGGQKSVFECFLNEAEKRALLQSVAAVLDLDEDRFFVVRLDPRSKVQILGIAVRPTDPSYFYIA